MKAEYLLMCAAIFGGLASAQTTLISESAAGVGVCDGSVAGPNETPSVSYESFTTTAAYSNVTIAANLFNLGSGAALATAYLSNSVGPGATAIATSSPVSVPGTGVQNNFTLFSGLNLPAGTYYLVMTGNLNCDVAGIAFSQSTGAPTLGPGVTLNGEGNASPFIGSPNTSNPPATTFNPAPGSNFDILVTGTAGGAPAPTATPIEPSLMLELTGLAGLGIYQLRRRRRA
jgi:hypothetical protein